MRVATSLLGAAVSVMLSMAGSIVWAQEATGGLYGTVTGAEGELLPGVSVSLAGMGATRVQVSDVQARFRFLDLDTGNYDLEASLDGFSTVEFPDIDIRAGRTTTLEIQLAAAVGEIITVTSESPLLDERKVAQGSILTRTELETIPTARDPWDILDQAPNVLVDHVNVGGNQSSGQALFVTQGASQIDNSYLVDGVEITDYSLVVSPTFYDFDQFSQVEVGTGGSEITKLASGVSLNMVTKRGTNEFRGSARYLVTDADGYFGILKQGESTVDPDELGVGQEEAITGNRTDRIEEYGFEAGGPAWRDRVWLWGSWANKPMRTLTAAGQPEDYTLENVAVKLNARFTDSNSLVGSWSTGDKRSSTRGLAPSRAMEAAWTQRGPTDIMRFTDSHVFSSSLFLSGTWSRVGAGFQVVGNGGVGPAAPEPLLDADGVWQRNNFSYWSDRPIDELKLEGSYFFGARGSSQELKFGARFRQFDLLEAYIFPGRELIHYAGENVGLPPGIDLLDAVRAGEAGSTHEMGSVWLQDTVTLGNWTLNGGLRWDSQRGENVPTRVAAHTIFPQVLPALEYGGDADGLEWESLCPRIAATYALGEKRKTLLRASYARFAQALNSTYLWRTNPVGNSYALFYFFDGNDNNTWDGYDVDGEPVLYGGWNLDLADPASVESPNVDDPDLRPPKTDELMLSAEHSVLPELVVRFDLTYRHVFDVLEERQLVRDSHGSRRVASREDFFVELTQSGELPDGTPYEVDFYALDPSLQNTSGAYLTNGDRTRDYLGSTLSLTKRLSNQWMLRGYATYGRPEWNIPGSFYAHKDPTDLAGAYWSFGASNQDDDGDLFIVRGGRTGYLIQSSWAFNLSGMYQIAPDRPWGFNLAGNVYGREGYPLPYWIRYISRVDGIRRDADAVRSADQFRTDDVYTVDLRLEKEFATTGNVGFIFSLDAFNLLDESTVLRRDLNLGGPRPDYIDETLAPRIFRLGVRLSWR